MREITEDRLQVAYEGPGLIGGRMSMASLASGLRGQALMIERVGSLLFKGTIVLQVDTDDSFERGSLIIPVHILSDGLDAVESILTGRAVTSIAALLGILSFLGVTPASLYSLFKRLRGRAISEATDLPPRVDLDISIDQLTRIYNDRDIQKYLRQSLEPLRDVGINELQTRRNGQIINSVSKADLESADLAELEDLNIDAEIELDIEKAAWRRDLAWHFSDGATSFDAQIDDDDFWKDILSGEPFSAGDRMRVHLHTTAKKTTRGGLKVTRRISKVLAIEHVRSRQNNLFRDRK
jgi:hypothetical protein